MRGEKCVGDRVVFLGQDAACRIDETAARLDERGCRRDDPRLLGDELIDVGRRLPPLEIGIAAQRPEAAARRIDENAIDLAGESLHFGIALVRDHLRVHVR